MSVIDGQAVNSLVTNSAFLSRLEPTSTVSTVSLLSSGSGPDVGDVQRQINDINSLLGIIDNDDDLLVYTGTLNYLLNQNLKDNVVLLDNQIKVNADDIAAIETAITAIESDITTIETALNNRLTKGASDIFSSFTEKVTPAASDVLLIEDSDDSYNKKWVKVSSLPSGGGGGGALTITGSRGTPQSIVAGNGIAFTGSQARQMWFISGSGGVDVTATPQIAAATTVGQELILFGTSDTDWVLLEPDANLIINGEWYAYNNRSLYLVWDGSAWCELSRS